MPAALQWGWGAARGLDLETLASPLCTGSGLPPPPLPPLPPPQSSGARPPVPGVNLITTISPKTSSLIGNPNSAAPAQAAFILQANKVFRSFSLQRPCFLSHYLPHRQPSLPQKQDFFFLFVIFVVPFIYGWLFFLGFGSFSKGQGSKGGRRYNRVSLISSKMLIEWSPTQ